MMTYGQRLGARNVTGLANWSDEVVSQSAIGILNVVAAHPHPHDGRYRSVEILMRDKQNQWHQVAVATYSGTCKLIDYELFAIPLVERDRKSTRLNSSH